jgi:hypothetical protein
MGWIEDSKRKMERWLEDGDTWIGVFQNRDLSSSDCGRTIALPFSLSDGSYEKAEIGKARAPDTSAGLGWRYILIGKATSADEAISFFNTEGKQ